jgi:hypothetical protein
MPNKIILALTLAIMAIAAVPASAKASPAQYAQCACVRCDLSSKREHTILTGWRSDTCNGEASLFTRAHPLEDCYENA